MPDEPNRPGRSLYVATIVFTGVSDSLEGFMDCLEGALGGETKSQRAIHTGNAHVIRIGDAEQYATEVREVR